MILLLGSTGYIGQAFSAELKRRQIDFYTLSRRDMDCTNFNLLYHYIKAASPEFVINAAGYTGTPNVDGCEIERAQTCLGLVVLPVTVAAVCSSLGIPFGHVSSGCIYYGPPERQFKETDEPNFSFRHPPCSFYSGCKALAEEALRGYRCYIWRPRLPFDGIAHPKNYLTKLMTYEKIYEATNSISHRGDFVKACIDLWEKYRQHGIDSPAFGIYNMTNPGSVSSRKIVEMLGIDKPFWPNDKEFYQYAAKAPRSNCVLDVSKLMAAGVKMRPVEEALEEGIKELKI